MKTPVSPKVKSGGVWAGYATLILALLNTVTPDSLTFMGHLAPLGYGVVIGGSYALGAFLKGDPLRVPVDTTPPIVLPDAPAPVSFAATQAKLDAATADVPLPTVTPVYDPPAAAAAAAAAAAPEPAPPVTA